MASIAIAAILTTSTLLDTSIVSRRQVTSSLQQLKRMLNSVTGVLQTVTAVRGKVYAKAMGGLLTYIPLNTVAKNMGPVSERNRLRTTAIRRSKRIQTMLSQHPSRTIPAVDNMRIQMLESNLIKRVFQ